MTKQELLQKGYFPKELPPPFRTEKFAIKLSDIEKDWNLVLKTANKYSKADKDSFKDRFWESKWVVYSIPKVGFSRRLLGIPNPFHQSILSETISNRWKEIEAIFLRSITSNSKPVPDKKGKRALVSFNTFGEFKKEMLIHSFDKLFEIKTDVSRYYGTIYTHIIPWIIHTKTVAKANRKDATLLGNLLDKNLRESNSGQTLGIPIGPDTSLVIAEIIGCVMDEQIQKKFKTAAIKSFRYIDDYYIYCESQADAERVFKFVQSTFIDYQLDINEAKTKISKSPFPFETDWSIELGSFNFRSTPKAQQTDIESFVSLAFKHAKNNPKDSVLNFAITILRSVKLLDENWDLYQSLVLKIGLTEPVTLNVVAEILVSYSLKVDKLKVKNIIENIIKEHVPKGHHYEVAWALWICKEFNISLPNNIAELVFNSNDVISVLIALDLKSNGNINAPVSTANIEAELTLDSLMDEKWLLTYESLMQGWLTLKPDPIKNNEYFNILKKYNISFYDSTKKVKTFKVGKTNKLDAEYAQKAVGAEPKINNANIMGSIDY
ncbi:RNA-directed DNA polymerase [Mucilaginibacter phyllosphaerae]